MFCCSFEVCASHPLRGISTASKLPLTINRASTVDIRNMKQQLRNCRALSTGIFCQFFLLPFLGYVVVEIFRLPVSVGITLIIVVSSPGGSYSNWLVSFTFVSLWNVVSLWNFVCVSCSTEGSYTSS